MGIVVLFLFMKFYEEFKVKNTFKDEQSSIFAKAILNQDLKLMQQMKINGTNINYVGENYVTPLVFAYLNRKKQSFEELLKLNANPNIYLNDSKTKSLIYKIIKDNKLEYLDLLIKNNADLNLLHRVGHRPLCYAFDENNFKIVDLLLKNGAKANLADEFNKTVFTYLLVFNHYEKANYLLSLGVNVYAESNDAVKSFVVYLVNISEKTMTKSTSSFQELQRCKEMLEKQGFNFSEKPLR